MSETAIDAASVTVELNGLAKQARDVRNPVEPNPRTGEARDGARERRPQRQELAAAGRGRGRISFWAENGRSAQVYGVIWDVSTEGAAARIASA
jgi:hypothetical protein